MPETWGEQKTSRGRKEGKAQPVLDPEGAGGKRAGSSPTLPSALLCLGAWLCQALLTEFFRGLIEASGRPASAGNGPVAQEWFQCASPWEFSPVTARR